MASHSSRFASVCALFYERSKNPWFKEQAFRHFNYATYAVETTGAAWVGHTWPGTWWSDGYADYIKHYLDGMAAIPEWAPEGENHLIKCSSVVTNIEYGTKGFTFNTFDESGVFTARLTKKPQSIKINGKTITTFEWTPIGKEGAIKVNYQGGNKVEVVY
jgi:hypothetical protein